MSLVSRDPILLTPGPLTTSLPTKAAMLRDWGSWDAAFNAVTARVRQRLVAVAVRRHACVRFRIRCSTPSEITVTTADVATISVAIAAAGPIAPASSMCRIEIDARVVFGE